MKTNPFLLSALSRTTANQSQELVKLIQSLCSLNPSLWSGTYTRQFSHAQPHVAHFEAAVHHHPALFRGQFGTQDSSWSTSSRVQEAEGLSKPPQHPVFEGGAHPSSSSSSYAHSSQATPPPSQPGLAESSSQPWLATDHTPHPPPHTHTSSGSTLEQHQALNSTFQHHHHERQHDASKPKEEQLYDAYLDVCATHAQAPMRPNTHQHFQLFKEQLQAELRAGEQAMQRLIKRQGALEKFGNVGETAAQKYLRPVAIEWMQSLQAAFEKEFAKVRVVPARRGCITHTCTQTNAHTHIRRHTCTHTAHIHTRMHACTYTHKHAHVHTHLHTHSLSVLVMPFTGKAPALI